MRTLQATKAKARLAEVPKIVGRGAAVAITRHGETTAHVIPAPAGGRANLKRVLDRSRRHHDDIETGPLYRGAMFSAVEEGLRQSILWTEKIA